MDHIVAALFREGVLLPGRGPAGIITVKVADAGGAGMAVAVAVEEPPAVADPGEVRLMDGVARRERGELLDRVRVDDDGCGGRVAPRR